MWFKGTYGGSVFIKCRGLTGGRFYRGFFFFTLTHTKSRIFSSTFVLAQKVSLLQMILIINN